MKTEPVEHLAELVRERGLTAREIAKRSGGRLKRRAVSSWLWGRKRPNDENLRILARVLEVDIARLSAASTRSLHAAPKCPSCRRLLRIIKAQDRSLDDYAAECIRLRRALRKSD